MYLMTTQVYLI